MPLGASVELMSHSRKIQGLPRHQAGVPPRLAPPGPRVAVHTARGWGDVHSADLEAGLCPPEALPSLFCSGTGAIPVYLPAGDLPGLHVCSVGPAWSFSGWSSSAVCRGCGVAVAGARGVCCWYPPCLGSTSSCVRVLPAPISTGRTRGDRAGRGPVLVAVHVMVRDTASAISQTGLRSPVHHQLCDLGCCVRSPSLRRSPCVGALAPRWRAAVSWCLFVSCLPR